MSGTARTSPLIAPAATASPPWSGRLRSDLVAARGAGGRGRPDDDADEGEARGEVRRSRSTTTSPRSSSRRRSVCASSRTCASCRWSPSTRDGVHELQLHPVAAREDIDDTLERLLELPAQLAAEQASGRSSLLRRVPGSHRHRPELPALMRAVFQEQPEVAHVYVGSKRDMMQRLFNDENEPFYRSAKTMEIGAIPEPLQGVRRRSVRPNRPRRERRRRRRPARDHGGHPYATQELPTPSGRKSPTGFTAPRRPRRCSRGGAPRGERALHAPLGAAPRAPRSSCCRRSPPRPGRPLGDALSRAAPPAVALRRATGAQAARRRGARRQAERRGPRAVEPFRANGSLADVS